MAGDDEEDRRGGARVGDESMIRHCAFDQSFIYSFAGFDKRVEEERRWACKRHGCMVREHRNRG